MIRRGIVGKKLPMQKTLATLTALALLLAAALACAENPAKVQVHEGYLTIYGIDIPLSNVTIEGYGNIPTPTSFHMPTASPASTPNPTRTPTPAPTDAPDDEYVQDSRVTISGDDWGDDSVLSQYYGRTITVQGFIDGFSEYRTVVWQNLRGYGKKEGLFNGARCWFPNGWAEANEELLWDMRNNEHTVLATGTLSAPDDPLPFGMHPDAAVEDVRNKGLSNCTLKPLNDN